MKKNIFKLNRLRDIQRRNTTQETMEVTEGSDLWNHRNQQDFNKVYLIQIVSEHLIG